MNEEEVCVEIFGDTLMLGKPLAVVGRQCVNADCKRRQQGDRGIRNSLRGLEQNMGHQGKRGVRPLIVTRDRFCPAPMTISAPPIAETVTLGRDGRAHTNGDLVGDGALVMSGFGKDGHLVSFVLGEMCVFILGDFDLVVEGAWMLAHLAHPTC